MGSTVDVAGVPITAVPADVAVDALLEEVDHGRRGGPVRFVNAYCVALADADAEYASLLRGWGRNYPDGKPVALVARRGNPGAEQVRGPWFFEEVIRRGVGRGVRHYFFGTDDATLALLRAAIDVKAPGAVIAGMTAPPMGTVEEILTAEMVATVAAAHPDIVWVGLGTPKQDHVGAGLSEALGGIPCVSVGAAFDFTAGTKKESPEIWRRLGLEWAHRFASEPRRLWRRYVFGNARFLAAVARSSRRG